MIKIKESQCRILNDGTEEWRLNGQIHRFYKPAVTHTDGTQEWFLRGWHHRENAPSIVRPNGDKIWHMHGELHREDGPAIVRRNGDIQEWYVKGVRHREDGPSVIFGTVVRWFLHGIEYKLNDWAWKVSLPEDELIELKLLYG